MESNFYKTYFELEKDNWWFRVRRNIISWLFKEYDLGKENKILDYGCGSGFLAGQLQGGGYDVYGVDISEEAVGLGTSMGVRNLSRQSEVRVNFPGNSFDVVVAMDVVEHIENDRLAAKEFERLLRPGGYLMITVPAYQWMWGVQDEVAHHFRRYNMESLLSLFRGEPGLAVIKKTYFNTFLFVPIAAVRLASRLFKIKNRESDFDINGSFLNRILYRIFNLEAEFLKYVSFPFGVSILLVLKKN